MNLQLTHLTNKVNSQLVCHIFLKREPTVTRTCRQYLVSTFPSSRP